jgi:hypothetical protein
MKEKMRQGFSVLCAIAAILLLDSASIGRTATAGISNLNIAGSAQIQGIQANREVKDFQIEVAEIISRSDDISLIKDIESQDDFTAIPNRGISRIARIDVADMKIITDQIREIAPRLENIRSIGGIYNIADIAGDITIAERISSVDPIRIAETINNNIASRISEIGAKHSAISFTGNQADSIPALNPVIDAINSDTRSDFSARGGRMIGAHLIACVITSRKSDIPVIAGSASIAIGGRILNPYCIVKGSDVIGDARTIFLSRHEESTVNPAIPIMTI